MNSSHCWYSDKETSLLMPSVDDRETVEMTRETKEIREGGGGGRGGGERRRRRRRYRRRQKGQLGFRVKGSCSDRKTLPFQNGTRKAVK